MAVPVVARATDPVMDWNDIARQLIVVQAFAPVQQTRAMAIVHVAIHDAVNAITGERVVHDVADDTSLSRQLTLASSSVDRLPIAF